MPRHAQTTEQAILEAARRQIEAGGLESLSWNQLAAALGIRPPSLYGYFESRDALLKALNTQTMAGLEAAMQQAMSSAPPTPADRLLAAAGAYRAYALQHPQTYLAAMVDPLPARQPDPDLLLGIALPLQTEAAAISGQAQSLTALRALFALIHGFALLEINQKLQRGGDLEAATLEGVRALIRGWAC